MRPRHALRGRASETARQAGVDHPGLAALGVGVDAQQIDALVARHAAQPWYPDAVAAWQQIAAGDLSLEPFGRSRPLFYGRWDEAAQAHATVGVSERQLPARLGYFAGVDLDARATRAVVATLDAPVLLYGGELDPLVTPTMLHEAATLVPHATVTVQAGGGHFPWVDDPAAFAAAVGNFFAG